MSWNVWLFLRPNGGFMNQLGLWEAMRCRIDQNNKSYRTYRLKHMAQEVQGSCNTEYLVTRLLSSCLQCALIVELVGWPGNKANQQMMLVLCDFQMQVMLKTWLPLWLLIPLPNSWIQLPTSDAESAGRALVFSSSSSSSFSFFLLLPRLPPFFFFTLHGYKVHFIETFLYVGFQAVVVYR